MSEHDTGECGGSVHCYDCLQIDCTCLSAELEAAKDRIGDKDLISAIDRMTGERDAALQKSEAADRRCAAFRAVLDGAEYERIDELAEKGEAVCRKVGELAALKTKEVLARCAELERAVEALRPMIGAELEGMKDAGLPTEQSVMQRAWNIISALSPRQPQAEAKCGKCLHRSFEPGFVCPCDCHKPAARGGNQWLI